MILAGQHERGDFHEIGAGGCSEDDFPRLDLILFELGMLSYEGKMFTTVIRPVKTEPVQPFYQVLPCNRSQLSHLFLTPQFSCRRLPEHLTRV